MEETAECMLVLIGATPEGKKELVGFQTGVRESAQSWRELLTDIKQRGLEIAPDLAVGDGALGFWKAIEEVFPGNQAAEDRNRCDAAYVLDGAMDRSIFAKRPMSPQLVIIGGISRHDAK